MGVNALHQIADYMDREAGDIARDALVELGVLDMGDVPQKEEFSGYRFTYSGVEVEIYEADGHYGYRIAVYTHSKNLYGTPGEAEENAKKLIDMVQGDFIIT